MGRLSTAVAAVGVDAGNLPEKLPTISLFDALLPGSWSRSKSSRTKVGKPHAGITCKPGRPAPLQRLRSAHSHAKQRAWRVRISQFLTHINYKTHPYTFPITHTTPAQHISTMPFFIKPFFRKPFKLFAIDADTGQPLDPNVRAKTRVTYHELQNGSNGSKKLVAHKSASQVAKEGGGEKTDAKPAGEEAKKEDAKKEGSKKEDAPKDDAAKVEQKGNDVAWTPEEDEKLKAAKAINKSWRIIAEEMGRAQHSLKARFKEINDTTGNDEAKKDSDGKNDKEKQGGGNGNGGQGKQGKKGKKGGDNQQNNNQNKEPDKKSASKKEEPKKPASNKPASKSGSVNNNFETRFTMTDWLTLQEDDMFSFGELQCLSELIGKDLSQSWQRVAAKFFDLTGRRIHPDDVRDKFENMALMAEGKK